MSRKSDFCEYGNLESDFKDASQGDVATLGDWAAAGKAEADVTVAAGTAKAKDTAEAEGLLCDGEFPEDLGLGVKLIRSKEHGFGTDAVLLADFARIKNSDKACDLCTGCGIIPLLWLRSCPECEIYGVEIQTKAAEQFSRSLLLNGSPKNLKAVHCDLRKLKGVLDFGYFTAVTVNPPYKRASTGILSAAEPEKISRHETLCTLEDTIHAASLLLNFGGRLCMCQRPERLCDVICSMRNEGLEPKRLRFVSKRPDTKPWLFLIEGRKGAKAFLRIEPPLFIQDEKGGNSPELEKILGNYAELKNQKSNGGREKA